jgi:hypothetical protein
MQENACSQDGIALTLQQQGCKQGFLAVTKEISLSSVVSEVETQIKGTSWRQETPDGPGSSSRRALLQDSFLVCWREKSSARIDIFCHLIKGSLISIP